ncbi:hypothetical protein [Burkholderia ubonensis]|uniref:hypothetical protein n=1 Tax=Burkholderia ubonensis TaxID=101571 RepID=UPI0012FB1412|nr:hypothetical protein [Burkholderia ubonensis]
MKWSNADHGDSVFQEMSQWRPARRAAAQDIHTTLFALPDALNIQNNLIEFFEVCVRFYSIESPGRQAFENRMKIRRRMTLHAS